MVYQRTRVQVLSPISVALNLLELHRTQKSLLTAEVPARMCLYIHTDS